MQLPVGLREDGAEGKSDAVWRISLLGGLRAERGEWTVTRFRSQKFAALLAYLALYPNRLHTREELSDLFWPDADVEAARSSLRSALAALRGQLEPEGVLSGSVIDKQGRTYVRLEPQSFETDVAAFEDAIQNSGRSGVPDTERVRLLNEAISLYRGPLLPGFYDNWALMERERYAELYVRALRQMTRHYEELQDWDSALGYARQAILTDALNEEAHSDVLRLLMASGQTTAAHRHYESLERLMEAQLDLKPSPELRAILKAESAVGQQTFAVATSPAPPRSVPDPVLPLAPEAPPAPPVTPLAQTGTVHLPLTLPEFFGREGEVSEIREHLRELGGTRLLTVTGTGGSGKTRLSIEAVRSLGDRFTGGIWFVPLADVRDPSRLFDVMADALRVTRNATTTTQEQTIEALERYTTVGPVLLLLDNFEQLAEESSGCVRMLLHRVPGLSCLVTSRQRLLLDGERELSLAPLPFPLLPATPERLLLEFSSIQLFVNRAQSARSDFELNDRNGAAVAELCARLEGIPLAIELAAGWAQILTPVQMLERLKARFDLLVTRRRGDTPDRHRTLRTAIEWSYQLLGPEQAKFFAILSLFRGSWSLETVEVITGEQRALEFISELRDHSLLVTEESDDGLRFRMLETLREFAETQMTDTAERNMLAARHLHHFRALAARAEPGLRSPDQAKWLRTLIVEQENLRAALDWSLHPDRHSVTVEAGLKLAASLTWFWLTGGHLQEGRERLERALARVPEAAMAVRARALLGLGWLSWATHDSEATRSAAEAGLALCRETADHWGASFCLTMIALAYHHGGYPERARTVLDEAILTARAVNDPWLLGHTLHSAGHVLFSQGDRQAGVAAMEEAIQILRRYGDPYTLAESLRGLGNIFRSMKRLPEAIVRLEESVTLYRRLGDARTGAHGLIMLGYTVSDVGDYPAAISYLESGLRICREIGDRFGAAHALHNLGHMYFQQGKIDESLPYYREALQLFHILGYGGDLAMALENNAEVCLRRGNPAGMIRLTAAATALRIAAQVPQYDYEETRLNTLLAEAKAIVGPEAYDTLWAEGQALSRETAVEQALRG